MAPFSRHIPSAHRVALALAVLAVGTHPARRLAAQSAPSAASAARANTLPARLSDADFWKLETDISEPDAYFQIEDNYTSNEPEVGQMMTLLRAGHHAGGVYLGVGPEQNFSYIAAVRPQMAFIIDIRRQAIMQHLMFKAMFELSKDRADFISILFSLPRPAGLDSTTPIQKIWDAYWYIPRDSALSSRNYNRIVTLLTKTHGFTFSAIESGQLTAVFNAFYSFGPQIATRGNVQSGRGGGSGSTFAGLTGYVYDDANEVQSFMSTEANFEAVKALQDKNLIVPVSGDFGGVKALRAIGAYLTAHGGTVSAYYLSNVEQYLFQDGKQSSFYANVATLPINDTSVFIRPYTVRTLPENLSLCPIGAFLKAFTAGRVYAYNSTLSCAQ